MRGFTTLVLLTILVACSSGPPEPALLDTRNDQCSRCRMAVSDPRFAAQIVAPGELPRFFDDLGCLVEWLKEQEVLPEGAVAYVADHRSETWVRAAAAVYSRVPGLETPMGSHVIAHADVSSRELDPDSRRGSPLTAAEFFGSAGVPGGKRR